MNYHARISRIYGAAREVLFDDASRIVLFSDCHRGDGTWSDDFMKNQNLYFAALTHYYFENYTYIEIGDGDELWKNKSMPEIEKIHSNAFWLLTQFYREGRLYLLYGNHDICKRSPRFVHGTLYNRPDERTGRTIPMFEGIEVSEGIILKHRETGRRLFLLHGHQADTFNSDFWRLSRFLVRHVWKPLELIGVHDPTSAAKNYQKKEKVEKNLIDWAASRRQPLVAGHTHRPAFPEPGQPPYFNDGSCVHPRCITAIEIAQGCITLVKWHVRTRTDGTLYVGRDVLAGPRRLAEYYTEAADPAPAEPERP